MMLYETNKQTKKIPKTAVFLRSFMALYIFQCFLLSPIGGMNTILPKI